MEVNDYGKKQLSASDVNMEAVDMPSERFWQNAPDMNSMTKTVSSQSQRNAASKVKSKNIWKSSR